MTNLAASYFDVTHFVGRVENILAPPSYVNDFCVAKEAEVLCMEEHDILLHASLFACIVSAMNTSVLFTTTYMDS